MPPQDATPVAGPPPLDGAPGLTAKEQALWLLHQFAPEVGVLNVPVAIRLPRLRWWPLHTALRQMVYRHPALRTIFPAVDGMPIRLTLDPDDPRVAVRVEPVATTDETLDRDLRSFAGRPFELTERSPVRVGHFTGTAGGEVLCVVVQHLVFDAVSARILVTELMQAYIQLAADGQLPQSLTALAPAFVEPPPRETSIAYWREHLAGAQSSARALDLGTAATGQPGYRGDRVLQDLSPATGAALADLSAQLKVTPNIVLLAAYYVLLSRHGAGDDIVVGMPVDARDRAAAGAIGYHVNVVAIRATVAAGESFRTLVATCRTVFLNALEHSDVSIDDIFPGSYETANTTRSPLFRYMINFAPVAVSAATEDIEPLPVSTGYSRLDLILVVLNRPAGTTLELSYRDEVFTRSEITALLQALEALVVAVAASADEPLADLPGLGARVTSPRPAALAPAPAPPTPAPPAAVADAVPVDELTELVTRLWRDLLQDEHIDATTNFFTYGGSSIVAARLVARIKQLTGLRMRLRDVFAAPTPAAFAARMAQRREET